MIIILEEPLPKGGSCLLGSINLSEFTTTYNTFDFDEFRKTVHCAVIALNEVLDEGLPLHPLQEQKESVRDWRQIGLGIFGLADLLIKLKIRYGSKEAIDLCDMIGFTMADEAIYTSTKLASINNTYPKYNKESILQSPWLSKNITDITKKALEENGLYNSQLLTIAPTGSLSNLFGVSGGIEPIYSNYYERKTESLHGHDEYYKIYTPIVKKYMDENNILDDKDLPDYFVTAQNLDYKERIDMQAIWQKHIDASISSTVNVPNSFTVEDVEELYMRAWEKGLKGVTIFRDGCKRTGILSTNSTKKEEIDNTSDEEILKDESKLERGMIIKVDNNTIGKERHLTTGCGSLHCASFFDPDNGELLETYLSKGSTGGCQSNLAAISRLISLCARGGIDVYSIVDQLNSCMACPSYVTRTATKHDTSKGNCCPSAVGYALLDMYLEMQDEIGYEDEKEEVEVENKVVNKKVVSNNTVKNPCPECGAELIFEGGCISCKQCGYSKCD